MLLRSLVLAIVVALWPLAARAQAAQRELPNAGAVASSTAVCPRSSFDHPIESGGGAEFGYILESGEKTMDLLHGSVATLPGYPDVFRGMDFYWLDDGDDRLQLILTFVPREADYGMLHRRLAIQCFADAVREQQAPPTVVI